MFDSSTIGQSRNQLDLGSTAIGQLATAPADIASKIGKKEYGKAFTKALHLTPIKSQIGGNIVLNLLGLD